MKSVSRCATNDIRGSRKTWPPLIVEQLMLFRALDMIRAGRRSFEKSQRSELAYWLAHSIMGNDGDPALAKQMLNEALHNCDGVAKTGRAAIKRRRS